MAVRERLRDLDFKEEFIEQLLKDYPARKIEEKLDLLMEKKNIQNPAGWLRTALKNDYWDKEQESRPISMDSHLRGNNREDDGNDGGGSRNDK
jgi:hypothetical protein